MPSRLARRRTKQALHKKYKVSFYPCEKQNSRQIFGKAEKQAVMSSRRAWRDGGLNKPCFDAVVEVRGFEPLFLRVTEQLSTYLACCRLSSPQSQQANFTSTKPLFPSEVRDVTSCGSLLNHAG